MTTELLTYENSTGDYTARRFIRDGIAGNYEVVLEMIRVIRSSTKDYRVKNIAAELLKERNLTSYSDPERILRVIFDYVVKNVAYIQDPKGAIESVKGAYRTLFDKFGDCDDLTDTLCSLIASLGFESADICIALAKYSPNDITFQHVYAVVYLNGNRYPLDASLPHAQFGQEVKPYEVKEINVFDNVQGLDGFSGIWTNLRYTGRKASKATLGAIPNIANFLPLGFVSSSALSTGAALLNSQGTHSKSFSEVATNINKKLDTLINDLVKSEVALDLAQSEAAKAVSQLALTEKPNAQDYQTIKNSINEKFTFIQNFEEIAKANGWKVVYLNANAITILGASATAYGAYKLYKLLTRGYE